MGENGSLGGESDKDNDNENAESGDAAVNQTVDEAKKDRKNRRVKKTKYAPEDESEADRDRRTVFVGNVAVEVLKSKVSLHIPA